MAVYPPSFDELWVVSDLHMGGDHPGFQVFNRGARLAALIDHVASQPATLDVALVVNGDVVDSLAERQFVPGYVALDVGSALGMMDRLYEDPSFKPVWEALARLVQHPRRHLVFVVGNHDIEIALPAVENSLRRRLQEGAKKSQAEALQARVHFSAHGAGFACYVGSSRVFCTHGNEVDAWNWVDYNRLGQLGNAISAGRAVTNDDWEPNAGTRLVVDVMNIVKKEHPFVDLLKPETAAVAAVLMAIDQDTFKKVDLTDAFPVLRDKMHGARITGDLLGGGGTLPAADRDVIARKVASELLGPELTKAIAARPGATDSEDDLLLDAGTAVADGRRASDEVADDEETLGAVRNAFNLFAGRLGLIPPQEGLRLSLLDWLRDDTTYDVRLVENDDLYQAMFGLGAHADQRSRVADSVNFVVTGHTHLARAGAAGPHRYYFNCGTWIRLLALTQEAVATQDVFDRDVWPQMQRGTMTDLDQAKIPGPSGKPQKLVLDRTNTVRIAREGKRVTGALLRVEDTKNGGIRLVAQEDATGAGLEPFVVG